MVDGGWLTDAYGLLTVEHHLTEVVDVGLADTHLVEEVILELVAQRLATEGQDDVDAILEGGLQTVGGTRSSRNDVSS